MVSGGGCFQADKIWKKTLELATYFVALFNSGGSVIVMDWRDLCN